MKDPIIDDLANSLVFSWWITYLSRDIFQASLSKVGVIVVMIEQMKHIAAKSDRKKERKQREEKRKKEKQNSFT